MILKIKNNLTKQEFTYPAFDISDSRNFYHFSIRLNGNEPTGEYTYYLIEDNKVISSSLLQIGDYQREDKTYTNDNNGFKVYNG